MQAWYSLSREAHILVDILGVKVLCGKCSKKAIIDIDDGVLYIVLVLEYTFERSLYR